MSLLRITDVYRNLVSAEYLISTSIRFNIFVKFIVRTSFSLETVQKTFGNMCTVCFTLKVHADNR